jgi:hypothetical protein
MIASASSFQSLRVALDARLPASVMVVVSSARNGDGEDELAYGIAHAFFLAGRRTAIISLSDSAGDLSRFGGSFYQAPIAPDELERFIAQIRSQYDVVIVASPPLGATSATLEVCRIASGVLLAVRLGRRITADDESAVKRLNNVGATILGVVAMRAAPAKPAAQAIDTIAAQQQAFEAAMRSA